MFFKSDDDFYNNIVDIYQVSIDFDSIKNDPKKNDYNKYMKNFY